MTQLGQLLKVDLREIWQTEDRDFTPWLAREEHLQILGDTIGLELELEAQEKEVGPFRADILCKNTLDGSWVLIENQIEKTDHRHLGQLLTYAAGLDAVTIVWIASRFTEEHRSAIDWLNRITDRNFSFFGLEVELWRINDSLPAPKFNIISQPNEWSLTVSRAAKKIEDEGLSESGELQYKYWTALSEYLQDHSNIKLGSPGAKGWHDFALGKANITLRLSIATKTGKITAGVYLYKNMKERYETLNEQKQEIEQKFGQPLDWENSPTKQTAVIKIEKLADISNETDWINQHAWLKEMLEKFKRVFRPIVKEF
ncbi:MAG: DUF4268 domain-containing protein [Rhodospirillales bacterium]|nr:DUF4268 domain-containing protein [Rhodospirillales bacterium]